MTHSAQCVSSVTVILRSRSVYKTVLLLQLSLIPLRTLPSSFLLHSFSPPLLPPFLSSFPFFLSSCLLACLTVILSPFLTYSHSPLHSPFLSPTHPQYNAKHRPTTTHLSTIQFTYLCVEHEAYAPYSSTGSDNDHSVSRSVDSGYHSIRSRFDISCYDMIWCDVIECDAMRGVLYDRLLGVE